MQFVGRNRDARVKAERGPKAVALRAALIAKHGELEAMVNTRKEETLVAKRIEVLDTTRVQEQFAQFLATQVRINARWHHDAEVSTFAQQHVETLGKQLISIDIATSAMLIDNIAGIENSLLLGTGFISGPL